MGGENLFWAEKVLLGDRFLEQSSVAWRGQQWGWHSAEDPRDNDNKWQGMRARTVFVQREFGCFIKGSAWQEPWHRSNEHLWFAWASPGAASIQLCGK